MKIVKYLLLLLLVVAIGLAIFAAMQPDAYEVKRTRVIDAPVEVVYNNVIDFKKYNTWGPWVEEDPSMTFSYGDVSKGLGATSSWAGKKSTGTMEIIEAKPNASVINQLEFEGVGNATGFWEFNPKEKSTEVTWGIKTEETPFIMKFFSAVGGGYDKVMGPMFARGLERLDSVAHLEVKEYDKMANTFSVGEVSKKELDTRNFIGYERTSKMDRDALQKSFMESMPKAGTYAAEKGLLPGEYTPGAIYTDWDQENGKVDLIVGLFLKKDLAPAEGMKKMSYPKGDVVMVSKYGNYGIGDEEAHAAIDTYIKEHNLAPSGPVYEMYVNDPTTVTPNKIQTDIYYPVQ